MHHTRARLNVAILLTGTALLVVTSWAEAQSTPQPRLSQVFPMGGKAGTTFEIKAIGQDLDKIEGLYFSFPGVKVEVLESDSVTVPTDPKKPPVKPPPALQAHRFRVALPADAPIGIHDVRVITKGGVSNPRAFVVGDMEEVNEKEPNDDTDKAQSIPVNCVVNGVISVGTDVDYFAIAGKKGQRVVCSVRSTSIDSKLPAAVEMYDRKGSYYGLGRNYADGDAVLDVTLPEDGEYLIRVFSFTYTQGGIDYFYRLTVSTAPWIDAVFPPVVEPGKESDVTVYGRNLPGGVPDPTSVIGGQALDKVSVKVKPSTDVAALHRLAFPGHVPTIASMLDGFALRLKNPSGTSNPYLLTYARFPVVLDNGDNDTQATAQKVTVPCEIAGRIEKKGDVDWYSFHAKKGEVISIDAFGERIGSPLDLFFQVVSDKGTLIIEQDDTAETMAPHFTGRTDDPPRYRFVVPADATYYVRISSRAAFTEAGPRHLYVLRIGNEQPDFQVIAMPISTVGPDSTVLGQHGNYAFNVFVWRLGGFAGDITLSADGLPPGLFVRPQIVSSAQKQAVLVVGAGPDAALFTGAIKVLATGVIGDKKVVREVRSASITWPVPQPNTLTMTRLDRELVVAVRDKAPYSLSLGSDKVVVAQGEKVSIPLKMETHWPEFKSNVLITAAGLPPGLNLPQLTLSLDKSSVTAVFDSKGGAALPPGYYTIVLRGQTQPPNLKPAPPMLKAGPMNYVQATPPITLVVLPKTLGKLTATPAPAKVQAGKDVEVTVKLARQYDLPVPLKVEAVIADTSVRGITAKTMTLDADKEEVKLILVVAADAPLNPAVAVTIRATAMFESVPIVHETKVNLAITK